MRYVAASTLLLVALLFVCLSWKNFIDAYGDEPISLDMKPCHVFLSLDMGWFDFWCTWTPGRK